jgi:hypothetical protein
MQRNPSSRRPPVQRPMPQVKKVVRPAPRKLPPKLSRAPRR